MTRSQGGYMRRLLPFVSAGLLLQVGTCTDESAVMFAQLANIVTASIVGDFVNGSLNLPNVGSFGF